MSLTECGRVLFRAFFGTIYGGLIIGGLIEYIAHKRGKGNK